VSASALPVERNLRQFPELHPALDAQSALAEANRCLFCFDAPCTVACPTHIDVPRFIKKIATGNLRGSAITILDANILGLSCSRVCPVDVLCEGSCVMHRYNQKPIEIGRLQRYAMDRFYDANTPLANGAPFGPALVQSRDSPLAYGAPSGPGSDRSGDGEGVPDGPGRATKKNEDETWGGVPFGPPRPGPEGVPDPQAGPPAEGRTGASGADRGSAPHCVFNGAVACIGGGPASLACAAELRRHGWRATIFDNRPLPGGLNTYGVAEYKLRASDSLKEVAFVRSLGVEFRQAEVGAAVPLEQLESEYDAIFIGVGLGAMEKLGIPGEDLPGVIDALRFIERYKTFEDFTVRGRVVVIGGGNTAIDAANAAKRLGADEVHLVYRRTEREMPAFRFEYDRSKVEGVRFHWLAQPVEILAREGAPWGPAAGVRFIETRLGPPDSRGRRVAVPVEGSYFELPCELVIPALGQSRFMGMLSESRGIRLEGGSVAIDRPTGRTTNPRYYAGGDCVNGGREVVDAVADGKRAALAMVRTMGERQEASRG